MIILSIVVAQMIEPKMQGIGNDGEVLMEKTCGRGNFDGSLHFGVGQWVEDQPHFEVLLDVDMLDLKVDPTSVGLAHQPGGRHVPLRRLHPPTRLCPQVDRDRATTNSASPPLSQLPASLSGQVLAGKNSSIYGFINSFNSLDITLPITVDPRSRIALTFRDLAMEEEKGCPYDWVAIRDVGSGRFLVERCFALFPSVCKWLLDV